MLTITTMDELGKSTDLTDKLREVEKLRRLVSGHQGLFRSPVILVEWDQAPNCIWPIRLPECMGTAREGYGEYQRYYLWERLDHDHLCFNNAPIADQRFHGQCSADVQVTDNQLTFSISIINQAEETWFDFFIHICMLHIFTSHPHESSFAGNHFIFDENGAIHVQAVNPQFPELEFAWCSLASQLAFAQQFKDKGNYLTQFVASHPTIMTERQFLNQHQQIALDSPYAALLGWSGWPCTDLALLFDDILPNQTQSVSGTVSFKSTSR